MIVGTSPLFLPRTTTLGRSVAATRDNLRYGERGLIPNTHISIKGSNSNGARQDRPAATGTDGL